MYIYFLLFVCIHYMHFCMFGKTHSAADKSARCGEDAGCHRLESQRKAAGTSVGSRPQIKRHLSYVTYCHIFVSHINVNILVPPPSLPCLLSPPVIIHRWPARLLSQESGSEFLRHFICLNLLLSHESMTHTWVIEFNR